MSELAKNPKCIFLGQTVVAGGAALGSTLSHIPLKQRCELPVAENFQLGFCTGLALAGWLPVCVFPRINFLIEALPQLIQHLDKLPEFGNGFNPRVIIRTAIASDKPLNPGPQHLGSYCGGLRQMLRHIEIVQLFLSDSIAEAYRRVATCEGSTIVVEYLEMYGD